MRIALLILFNLAMCYISIAQESFNNTLIDRLSCLKQNQVSYFNLGNYSILTETFSKEFNSKNILSLGKKYSIGKRDTQYQSISIKYQHAIIKKTEEGIENIPRLSTYYFIKKNETETQVIGFYSMNYTDTLIEQEFINLYLQNKIPLSISLENAETSIQFAGRKIEKYPSCQWMDVNSLQCPYRGQMNWALHENLNEAKRSINTQFLITRSKKMTSIISDEMIDVIFEGKVTKAKKITLKIKAPKFVTGGSNELIIYYVAEEIRGRFISCVLSHYSDEKLTESGVPALLAQVIKIKT